MESRRVPASKGPQTKSLSDIFSTEPQPPPVKAVDSNKELSAQPRGMDAYQMVSLLGKDSSPWAALQREDTHSPACGGTGDWGSPMGRLQV